MTAERSRPAELSRPLRTTTRGAWRTPAISLLFGAGLWLASPGAWAQSLQELYDAAHGYDANYLAARAQVEASGYAAAQADALRRPSASLAGNVTRTETYLPGELTSRNTGVQAQIQAQQALYNRSNGPTIAKAYKQVDIANADLANAEQDLIVRVTQAYFDVLGAQDTLGYARASKQAITEQLASAKRNFEVGTATITDTREAQARYDLAVATEIAAENDLRTKRVALDLLVGRTDVQPRPLATPVMLPPLSNGDIAEWLQRADAEHPTIRRALLGLDTARLDTETARAAAGPTVNLVGSWGAVNNSATTSSGGFAGTTIAASLGVQVSVPLYTGGSIQNRVQETLSLENRAINAVDAAKRSVALATRQAYLGVQSGQAQVSALEAAESSTLLALQATQLGYKVGVRVNLDVLNAQTQLFQTQRDLAKARYDLLVGTLKLRQAAGQLQPGDLQTINVLLAR